MQIAKALVAGFGLLAAMAVSQDAQALTCSTASCTGTVRKLFVWTAAEPEGAHIRVQLVQDLAPTSCTLDGGKYWKLAASDENSYKVLIAAFLAGKQVTLRMIPAQA